MSVPLSKPDVVVPTGHVMLAFVFLALVFALGLTFLVKFDHGENLGEFADTITFAEKIATLPDCEIAFHGYARKGECTDDIHGIRVMKSARGLDFIDVDSGRAWKVIASVDNFVVDGRLERRIWESAAGSLRRVEKALGEAVR
ncbi:hypothetical protein HFO56_03130 [Rhizobium laguerreae]|uniref:hypothetical protein n=1 Tax=Rhizobium laguerreae TaxID=1076926 RepID=UPI001C910047|nr:hypothetical protein [Rhizobium laguerreae]MBY3151380.1 hypothetical protein [Rhizobium laguerreae]